MLLDLHFRKTLRSGNRLFHLNVELRASSQRIVLYGPSGAGKSQILKAIAGLMTPDSGYVRLNGEVLFDSHRRVNRSPQQRKVAYVFQDYALFPHLSVRQNIGFSLQSGWLNPRAAVRRKTVDYWLEAMQLDHLADQPPSELSGGQRQRTALARALASEPRALLLDEPFSALDPALRVSMRRELDELQHRLDVPIVMITHDLEDAQLFGEQIFNVHDGRVAPSVRTPAPAAQPDLPPLP